MKILGDLRTALVILLAAGAWLAARHAKQSRLESEVAALQSPTPPSPSPSATSTRDRQPTTPLDRHPIDWAAMVRELRQAEPIGTALSTFAPLLASLSTWSADDLLAALDEIARADLSSTDRKRLEDCLAAQLIEKDPALGFSRFMAKERHDLRWTLAAKFAGWMERDPAAAIGWLRRHTHDGGWMDSTLIERTFYPALVSNPARSEEILAALPETIRLNMLSSMQADDLDPATQETWIRIVRNHLPEPDRNRAVSWQVQNISDGDGSAPTLAEAAAFLERVQATPGEREACVMALAEQPGSWPVAGVEGIGQFRSWVDEQAPSLVDKATIKALDLMDVSQEIVDLALRLHEETGDDSYLKTILDRTNADHGLAGVDKLIEGLSNEADRDFHRNRFQAPTDQ